MASKKGDSTPRSQRSRLQDPLDDAFDEGTGESIPPVTPKRANKPADDAAGKTAKIGKKKEPKSIHLEEGTGSGSPGQGKVQEEPFQSTTTTTTSVTSLTIFLLNNNTSYLTLF